MLYQINMTEETVIDNQELIQKLQKKYYKLEPGTYELYSELWSYGECSSYSKERILFVAYTLSKNNIEFELEI